MAISWLGLHALTAEGTGSIPGWGAKITQAMRHGHKKKKNPFSPSHSLCDLDKPILQFLFLKIFN